MNVIQELIAGLRRGATHLENQAHRAEKDAMEMLQSAAHARIQAREKIDAAEKLEKMP